MAFYLTRPSIIAVPKRLHVPVTLIATVVNGAFRQLEHASCPWTTVAILDVGLGTFVNTTVVSAATSVTLTTMLLTIVRLITDSAQRDCNVVTRTVATFMLLGHVEPTVVP